jgi:hypothetical protein
MATETTKTAGKKTAGALDIRNIIGLLLAIYGVILLFMGLFGDAEEGKTGGVNANLWAGLGLLVVGSLFMAWAKIRPVVVPADVHAGDQDQKPPGH